GFVVDNFHFANFAKLFTSPTTVTAIWNSVVLSVGVGVFLAVSGGALAIILSGEQTLLKRCVRGLAMTPLGIAHVVAGLLAMLAWYGRPFQLGGTLWLLGLAYVLIMLPYALKTCEAARGQVDASLSDAARVVGCTPVDSWRYVLF